MPVPRQPSRAALVILACLTGFGCNEVTPGGPVSVALQVNPAVVEVGAATQLSWQVTGATACEASGGWSGARPAVDGNEIAWIYEGTTFGLSCGGSAGNASSQAQVSVEGSPLQLSVDLDKYLVQPGESFLVDVTTSNPGSRIVDDVVVNVVIPDFVSIDPTSLPSGAICSDGQCQSGATVALNLGALAAGEVAPRALAAEVDEQVPDRRALAFDVVAMAPGQPAARESEFAEEGQSDVKLRVDQSPAQPQAGDQVVYSVVYEYTGTPPAPEVEINLELPGPVTFELATGGEIASEDGVVTWSLATPGTFAATVQVSGELPPGAQLRALASTLVESDLLVRASSLGAVNAQTFECLTDRSCGAGERCVDGDCVPDSGLDCITDLDCDPGEVCDMGSCVPAPPECLNDLDCDPGEVCDTGSCVPAPPECMNDLDCDPGEVCNMGMCVPDTPLACTPPATSCSNDTITPFTESCVLPEPPVQISVCNGTEGLENPATCSPTGTSVTYRITAIETTEDCNRGYDLDSCDGSRCILGGLSPGEGSGGVDNALAALAPVLSGVGADIGDFDQALHDSLCLGSIDWRLTIDTNFGENCATVQVFDGNTFLRTALLNFSSGGCLSGSLGDLPIAIATGSGTLSNTVLRMTPSLSGLSGGVLGATADVDTAAVIMEAVIDGGGAVVGQVLDINQDLGGDGTSGCDALSLSLDIGGAPE